MSLLPCLARLALLQRETIDRLELQTAVQIAMSSEGHAQTQLKIVTDQLQVRSPRWLAAPDASFVPALISAPDGQWGILRGKNSQGLWQSDWWDEAHNEWREQTHDLLPQHSFATIRLAKPYVASNSPVYQLIRQEVFSHKKTLVDVVVGGVMINVIALVISFYSMQVYDRVVPTGASQTLLVLTIGVLGAVLFEFIAKSVRSGLYEKLIDQVDQRLARTIYMRFLAIRLDQLPQSVGGLAAQMRGYETVRAFLTAITTHMLVDAPFALLFMLIIALMANWLAIIPAIFFVLSLGIGFYFRNRIDAFANKVNGASNLKTGLLVETVEGAETIKSGQGGWRMLSRWMETTDDAREYELKMRSISEGSQYLTAVFQQFSYILLVASGALLVNRGELTMGGLIAASILSGRILNPVGMIPNQIVQWAHTKAALQGLDRLWALQDDHHGQEHPVLLETIRGYYRFETVEAHYSGNKALIVPNLTINIGEKIGVLGPVGAGKTTLLRLLSGMYKPQVGRILLDDVDLSHIAKPVLADRMGYVAQDGRLFSGTLRENLILGLPDPGDEIILTVARQTGLMQTVVSQHSKGLQQEIHEGGTGLSGGQRQLVNLTRAFLRQPNIWLLDEPTASMDRNLELHVIEALKVSLKPEATLVLVTHKPEMLALCDRIIVIANHQIVMDGSRDQVIQKLQTSPQDSKQ
jgi:ATP-binding cassette subfamily C protein LapB